MSTHAEYKVAHPDTPGGASADVHALVARAERLLASGDAESADRLLTSRLACSPGDPALLRTLARARRTLGRPKEAAELLEQALQRIRENKKARSGAKGSSPLPRTPMVDPDDVDFLFEEARSREIRRNYHDLDHRAPLGRQGPAAEVPGAPGNAGCGDARLDEGEDSYCSSLAARPSGAERSRPPVRGQLSLFVLGLDEGALDPDNEPLRDVEADPTCDHRDEGIEVVPLDLTEFEAAEYEDLGLFDPEVDEPAEEEEALLDWALDADDFEEDPTREELEQHVLGSGRIARSERALQVALELGLDHGWDEAGIRLLAQVFELHWWSQAQVSMRRELDAGMTPDELALALELREFWRSRPEFAIDLRGDGSPFDPTWGRGARAVPRYRQLSWPLALALARTLGAHPDPAELMQLLDEWYDQWYTSPRLRRIYGAFSTWLYFRLGVGNSNLSEWPQWSFDTDLALEESEPVETGVSNRRYQALQEMGLIPQTLPASQRAPVDVPADA